MSSNTAMANQLIACGLCCKLVSNSAQHCPRCGTTLHSRHEQSLQRTLALLVTACLLYIPANIYPIMYTDELGTTYASTIIGGVMQLIEIGSIPIALIIFVFSVIVPSGKIMTLLYLIWSVKRNPGLDARQRTTMYRVTEFIGKWSMIDVFVVAILAALVHLGELLVVRPGVAAIAFSGVVIITMIAAENFDSRLLWDGENDNHGE